MQAFPDVVNADGISQAVVELVLRDQNGAPIGGQAVEFSCNGDGPMIPSTDSTYVGPLQNGNIVMATDQDGVARVIYVAGTQVNRVVTIRVRPYGIDANRAFDRELDIEQR